MILKECCENNFQVIKLFVSRDFHECVSQRQRRKLVAAAGEQHGGPTLTMFRINTSSQTPQGGLHNTEGEQKLWKRSS